MDAELWLYSADSSKRRDFEEQYMHIDANLLPGTRLTRRAVRFSRPRWDSQKKGRATFVFGSDSILHGSRLVNHERIPREQDVSNYNNIMLSVTCSKWW